MTGKIVDVKPKNKQIDNRFTDRLYPITLKAGQPMGLLLALTYKEESTYYTRVTG